MRSFFIGTLALTVAIVFCTSETVMARAQYKKAFAKAYPALAKKHGKKVGCTMCHPNKKSKKTRNDYGTALGKAIMGKDVGGKKNEKDAAKLKKAIELAAKEKSSTKGKTFGDLIKDEKLPGTDKEVKKDDKK